MNERGKPEAVWPARWKAPNKNKGKHHANPPSTRARVPATPRRGRTARPSTDWDSETKNRAYEPDEPSNGKILNGPERARQKRNAATARRPPEQRVTEARAKTAKPADADKRRYYTRTKDRVSEQKKDNADGCSRTVPHISLGDDVPTKGPSRAPCGGGTQRYAAYQIVRQFGCVRGLRLRGGKGVASTKGEPVASFWAATESTPTETTDATR